MGPGPCLLFTISEKYFKYRSDISYLVMLDWLWALAHPSDWELVTAIPGITVAVDGTDC